METSLPPPPPLPVQKPKTPSRISAAYLIFAVGFFYSIIPALAFFVSSDMHGRPDILGIGFAAFWCLITLGFWISGILIYRKCRIGVYLWWPLSAFVLLNIPVGTLIGGLVYMYLGKPDAKEDFRR